MPKEEWWLFYESFLKKADSENAVKKQKLVLYGTPKNVKEAAAWTAYTDQGTMNFEGVSLDACIDRKIEVYERDGSIITLCGVQSEKVTYKNVWIVPGESGGSSRIVPMACWRMSSWIRARSASCRSRKT